MGLTALAYTGDGGFENYKVIEKKTLNFLDAIKNSNKYYTIELHENNGRYRVFTDYGRLGMTSTKQVRETDSLSLALREFESIAKSKIKKGYKEVELAQSSTGSNKAKELIDVSEIKPKTTRARKKKSKLDPIIQAFVQQIFDEAGKKLNHLVKGDMNADGASPLGKLSSKQIEKGRSILQAIADMVNYKGSLSVQDVLNYTNEYYANIPKVFGSKISPEQIAICSIDRISEEMDILKFYEDALRMGGVIFDHTNIDKQYESLNSDIGILDPNSEKYKQLVYYVNSTESRHHHVNLQVKNIFTVAQKNAPAFDDSYGNVKELFHGSRSANLPGILSTNLRLPNSLGGKTVITGAMFGPGIYFASQSTKSSQYSCSRFGGTINKYPTAFMFIAEVALGKVYEVENAHYFLEPPKGYDSVRGVQGRSLLHDEYIIYRENQQQLRYIIEFEPKNKRY
ncbi:WGR domain-containing protein (plasmid) [Aneurinibacillus sp. Ricciae_BoGa-3]|uniref:WGR domain-containing protein n=1 Tax=Aneurinibacillus sp. Ricciae_BoGa-3 TaxID=3022697 RepID=UPI0023428268|nr:WGR domain-containing protein [Aneurinibacillus sp. Ricciae_BoGa-3]WCK57234.1 WGR domain-containing protein [Aneurinibacillus sp. Ricciae_BoGa-3]